MQNIARLVAVAGLWAVAACAGEPEDRVPAPAGEAAPPAPAPAPSPAGGDEPAASAPADAGQGGEQVAADPARQDSGAAPAVAPRGTHGAPRADVSPAPADPASEAGQDGAAILRRTAEVYEGIRSLQADFTMRVENRLLRTSTTSRGTLYQRRPDRILLDFAEPEGDVIVSDGAHFWIYYPSVDSQQVIRAPASAAGAGGVDLQAQFVGDPVARFDYTLHGREAVAGRDTWVLTLQPKDAGAGYESLKVWVDAEDSLVRRFELTEGNGTVRHFELSDIERNPSLGDELFRFTPPEGARIVERG